MEMMKNQKIGIFDSGIGGSTVLKEILKVLPNEDYIYYSDSINNPYGDKTDEQIYEFSKNIVEKFIKQNCKAIVIACNTASAKAANKLRKEYPQQIIIAIEPAYKMVHDFAYDKTTLIMATEGTIKSEKFNNLYNKYNNHKTYLLPCKGLADIIEKDCKVDVKRYLTKTIGMYKGKINNVVLGCTHYPLIKDDIENVIGKVTFFDGSYRLAVHLKDVLKDNELLSDLNSGKVEFIDSSNSKKKKERFFEIINNNIKD